MLYLCVSDIHGRLDALRAVLATAEKRSFHKLLVAGDLLYPGPEPLETWKRLNAAGAVLVQGVTDRALASLDPDDLKPTSDHEKARVDRLREVQKELGDLVLERVRRLPTHARLTLEDGGELVLVHGSPRDPQEALSFDMTDEEIGVLLGDECGDLVVCGMSHTPFDRVVGDVRIVNVGSVGEAPDEKVGRFAHAAWIESTPQGVDVELFTVPLG